MDSFQHIPLDRCKECIRLLRFVDGPQSSEHDHFVLETYDIAKAPSYVALSYTWGRPEPTHEIIVDGSPLSIRENLHVALRVLRSFFPDQASFLKDNGTTPPGDLLQENGYPLMWIDAICINQSDHLEKNHQVNMMGRIFSMAKRVICWLGDEAEDSGCVMQAIKATTRTRQYGLEVAQAMDAFINRPYWRRMWVIQEFILPEDIVILCGHKGAWWEDLHHFWHDEKFVRDADGGRRYFSGKSVQSVGKGGLAALISARSSRRGGYYPGSQTGEWPISINDIMTRFAYGECSDPRDRVYALLALIKPQAGVEAILADYTISAKDLYYRVLGYVGPLERGGAGKMFRKKLREALDSSSWVEPEETEQNEVVYETVGRAYSYMGDVRKEDRLFPPEVYTCLAKHLERPSDSMFCDGELIYRETIRRFQSFPRNDDPRTWRWFDCLLRQWMHIAPASDGSPVGAEMYDYRKSRSLLPQPPSPTSLLGETAVARVVDYSLDE